MKPNHAVRWTTDMDRLLRERFGLYDDDHDNSNNDNAKWDIICNELNLRLSSSSVPGTSSHRAMSMTLTPSDCRRRWRTIFGRVQRRDELVSAPEPVPWTSAEVQRLQDLVRDAQDNAHSDFAKSVTVDAVPVRTVSWTAIAKSLNKSLADVNAVWTTAPFPTRPVFVGRRPHHRGTRAGVDSRRWHGSAIGAVGWSGKGPKP
jgi:hypothetical protein